MSLPLRPAPVLSTAQVYALWAAAEYAVLSESIATELCRIVTTIFGSHLEQSPDSAPAAIAVTLEALRAARKLLESFPGMQEGILGPVGSLACCAGEQRILYLTESPLILHAYISQSQDCSFSGV